MSKDRKGFIGIDVGTQGVRLLLVDQDGQEIFNDGESLPLTDRSREEQSAEEWWQASLRLLRLMAMAVKDQLSNDLDIEAICVTSTSGTVIPLDKDNKPLFSAIMYSDQRSAETSVNVKAAAEAFYGGRGGYTSYNSSSGLSKMVWFVENYPEEAARIKYWIHASDYITGKLCGRFDRTDYTNALKSGYDVKKKEWPPYVYETLPIKRKWLQRVVPTGEVLGLLRPEIQMELDVNQDIKVVAGLTDGCASQIASGAVEVGDWNTTIGTTMVIKGITKEEIDDPEGRIYAHRHPQGYWMPGGAANIGADWVNNFSQENVQRYSKEGEILIPTPYLSYPLQTSGERFPFIAPEARGFEPAGLTPIESFVSSMEGLAFIEKYAYEIIEKLSGERVNVVFTAGGASNNDLWMKIRCNVLNLPIKKMNNVSGAMGAAITAASRTYFNNLIEAAKAMTLLDQEFLPEALLSKAYEERYRSFILLLKSKKFIKDGNYA